MSDNMVTFNGVRVHEADVLKAAAEIQQRTKPKPVEPGVYRWKGGTTDTDPFGYGVWMLYRRDTGGAWSRSSGWGAGWEAIRFSYDAEVQGGQMVPLQPVEGVKYEGASYQPTLKWSAGRWWRRIEAGLWCKSSDGPDLWRTGQLRPITPKPWTPTVGEWVQHETQPWEKACQVAQVTNEVFVSLVPSLLTGWPKDQLRPATPDEITAAKRIEPVDGLIVRGKGTWRVWRWNSAAKEWHNLSDTYKSAYQLSDLDLDHYDILDEYIVQGAKR